MNRFALEGVHCDKEVSMNGENMIEIKENALFIADSHYPHHGDEFLDLLKQLECGEVKTSQLFLMGDNFDLLFGYNDYIQTFSSEAIKLLQKLSKKLEIHYFEGNHDFCLKELFPSIKVYSRQEQPIMFTLGDKKIAMSHGDKYVTDFGYDFYCAVLRNKVTLTLLKPFEKIIINNRMKRLSLKHICKPLHKFEKKVVEILKYYKEADMVIEGHFHQAKVIDKYISLPSLACQGQVSMVKDGKLVFIKPEQL